MAWFVLLLAGLFEVGWSIGLKYTDGFTRPVPSVLTVLALGVSTLLLANATRTLPIGTAYPVWVGIGVLGSAVAGVVVFGEALSVARGCCLLLLVVATAGLKLTS